MDSQNYKSGADRVAAINADIQRTGGLGGGAITASGMISQDGFTPIARNTPVTPTIQAGSLDTPTTPLQMPNIPPSTSAEGLSAMALAQGEQVKLQQEAEQKVAETQAQVDTSKTGLQSTMDKIFGVQNSQAGLEAEQKLPEKNIALTDATNKLEASQRAQTNELRALEGQGLTDVQRAASSREINRKYAFEQADLALIQSAANRDLATAQSIVDRKIQLQMEPLKTKLDFAKFIYEQDREDNTAAQNKALDLKIKQFDRQYEKEENNFKQIAEIQLAVAKNGAPSSVVSAVGKAKNPLEAISAGGGYFQSPLEKAQVNKIIAETNASGNTVIKSVDANGNVLPTTPAAKALEVILGSGKFTAAQATAVKNAVNNGEDPLQVVKNQAKNLLTGANQTKIENAEAVQSAMVGLKDSLNSYYAAGGNTGLITGNFEKVANKLGQVKDPALAALAVEVQSQLQSYRNAISGTAYSDQEGKDIASVFPGINKNKILNDAIFLGRDKSLQSTIDGTYRSVLGSSYDELKKKQTVESSPTVVTSDYDNYIKAITGN